MPVACTSEANNCGTTAQWMSCNGICDAMIPADIQNVGNVCHSETNNCGEKNSWTIQCDGSCNASKPLDVANVWNTCDSRQNNCWDVNTGTIQCDGMCSATPPEELENCSCSNPPENFWDTCESRANNCWDVNTGTIQCDGSCSATTPSDKDNVGQVCDGPDADSCNEGTIQCDGSCSDDSGDIFETCDEIDNDCDDQVDEDNVCRRWGGGSRGWVNYCGDGFHRYNLGEECDDGNDIDGDGCDKNCRIEWAILPSLDTSVVSQLGDSIKLAMKRLRLSCYYDDVDYQNIRFKDVERSNNGTPAEILKTYCIVKWYDKTKRSLYHSTNATSVAEFVKMITKIVAMYSGHYFDEYNFYEGELWYTDVARKKRYASYIWFAHQNWLLKWVGNSLWLLKALKPNSDITKEHTTTILSNAGISKDYSLEMWSGGKLAREDAARILVDAYADRFVDYKYLYGNNIEMYQVIVEKLSTLPESQQATYVTNLITKLNGLDKQIMWEVHNIHVDGMIEFLTSMMQGEYIQTYYDTITSTDISVVQVDSTSDLVDGLGVTQEQLGDLGYVDILSLLTAD